MTYPWALANNLHTLNMLNVIHFTRCDIQAGSCKNIHSIKDTKHLRGLRDGTAGGLKIEGTSIKLLTEGSVYVLQYIMYAVYLTCIKSAH